jgi:hypothetical protein
MSSNSIDNTQTDTKSNENINPAQLALGGAKAMLLKKLAANNNGLVNLHH